MSEEKTRMVIYKIIAEGGQKHGRKVVCGRCGKVFKACVSDHASGVVCPICSMGLADGLVVEMPKKKRMKSIDKSLDEKVQRRLKSEG